MRTSRHNIAGVKKHGQARMAAIISSAEQALCKHQSAGNLRWMWPLGSVIMRRFFAQIYVLCCNCLSPAAAAARSSTLSCKSIYFACQRDHLSMTLACRLLPLLLVPTMRSEEHTSELQSHSDLVC